MSAPVRHPTSFRERVLAEFRSPRNVDHIVQAIRRVFPEGSQRTEAIQSLFMAMVEYGSTYGHGGVLVDSDPLGLRGAATGGGNLLEELQHLNQAFFQQHIRHTMESGRTAGVPLARGGSNPAAMTSGPGAPTEGEPLFYRMFEADSLRPPGLENLNGPGPLWELPENQGASSMLSAAGVRGPPTYGSRCVMPGEARPVPTAATHHEGFAVAPVPGVHEGFATMPVPGVAKEDMPWRASTQPYVSAETAAAEYYGHETPISAAMGFDSPIHLAETRAPGASGMNVADAAARVAATGGQPLPGAPGGPPSKCGYDGFFQPRRGNGGLAGMMEDAARRANLNGDAAAAALLSGNAARFERREQIPYWQRAGHNPTLYTGRWQSHKGMAPGGEHSGRQRGTLSERDWRKSGAREQYWDTGDMEETLGSGSAEFGGGLESHVRGWDMDRLRHPRGESYMRFGPRKNER